MTKSQIVKLLQTSIYRVKEVKENNTILNIDWVIEELEDYKDIIDTEMEYEQDYEQDYTNLTKLQLVALQMIPLCVELPDHTLEQKVKESYRLAKIFLELEK